MSDERKAIEQVMATWREATARGDLETVLGLMTDDAVFLRPDHEPMSREQFADIFRAFPAGMRIDTKQEIHDLSVSGDIGYAWTHLAVTMTPAGGVATTRSGHVLTVFRRGEDRRWRLARDANLLPTHAAPSHAGP